MAQARTLATPYAYRAPIRAYVVSYLAGAWLVTGAAYVLAPQATRAVTGAAWTELSDTHRSGSAQSTAHHITLGEMFKRFSGYAPRLAETCRKVIDGETKMFTGVMCGSYHDVWMELHEDLILTQGIDRAQEGSF